MWTLLLISILPSTQPAVEVQTLDGRVIAGSIIEFNADRITVDTAGGPVSLEIERLAALSAASTQDRSSRQPGVWVELADGSSLVGAGYTACGGQARIILLGGEVLQLPGGDVTAVRFQPHSEAIAAEWSRCLEAATDSDLLVVRRGESIDYHRGVLGDVTETAVHFELDGEVLLVKRAKVYGLVYCQAAGRDLGEPVCRVTDTDGSTWAVRSIELAGRELRWITLLGLEITRPPAAVAGIDFSQGKIVYLSDLEPESIQWTPYFGTGEEAEALAKLFSPREDQSLQSGPLELDGKPYRKGLALHSRSSLVYRLPGRFRRFKATVGIDDRVRPRGNAVLVIRGDDQVLLETTVAGTDPPKPVDLDIGGVRRLTILVDFGEDLDVADHVDLCEARIVK